MKELSNLHSHLYEDILRLHVNDCTKWFSFLEGRVWMMVFYFILRRTTIYYAWGTGGMIHDDDSDWHVTLEYLHRGPSSTPCLPEKKTTSCSHTPIISNKLILIMCDVPFLPIFPICFQCGTDQNPCRCKVLGPTLGIDRYCYFLCL